MPTLSSHVDQLTAQRMAETAKLEDRKTSQITAAALRWYLSLSSGARDALRRIEALGETEVQAASWAVSRALLDREYRTVVPAGMAKAEPRLGPDPTEDEIMAEAVRLTSRRP
ncbi:hypothetical protein [Phenylobacterium sp.]|uniref:hypothetical protein n=1 Tax=Phenylobacterium sp. TaxID=1871053 RepID=UPI002720F246|nr:hypothetical protein [Phenylobacterium sp.]MDO8378319.1 hypothetical protein [Phenylobacterium sp.]